MTDPEGCGIIREVKEHFRGVRQVRCVRSSPTTLAIVPDCYDGKGCEEPTCHVSHYCRAGAEVEVREVLNGKLVR